MNRAEQFQVDAVIAFARGIRRRLVGIRPDDPRRSDLTARLARYQAEWDQLHQVIPELPPFDEATKPR